MINIRVNPKKWIDVKKHILHTKPYPHTKESVLGHLWRQLYDIWAGGDYIVSRYCFKIVTS